MDDDEDEEVEDVEQLVSLLKRVRTDNLKDLHVSLNADHRALSGRYESLHEERINVERQYQVP
ncbi:hypothetical protein FOA52_000574 [Chlamydomonas sp. UWO 241]|nr:hypothetical protein FOA52_000574 [Chlamydomonas sp. UWO 241]